MGAYLSHPETSKETFEGSDGVLTFGGASMQGWRRTQEDAHIAELDVGSTGMSLFGVFDGHGGSEVAQFCSRHMTEQLLALPEVRTAADVSSGLVKLFHRMDEMLKSEDYAGEIEGYKGKRSDDEEDSEMEVESGGPGAVPGAASNGGGGSSGGVLTMDAINMLKRIVAARSNAGSAESDDAGGVSSSGPGSGSGGGEADLFLDDELQEDTLPEHRLQAGCTAVVALLVGRPPTDVYVANAGDSRAVLCRGGRALALSEDHKPAQDRERNRIQAAGGFLSEIGGVCRVNGNLNLSRAIGDLKYKSNDTLKPAEQIITAEPDVRHVTLTPEDTFLVLACDGVWDVMDNQEVVDFVGERLATGTASKDVACELLDSCLASNPKDAKGIGCDNMTAEVILLSAELIKKGKAAAAAAAAAPAAAQAKE